MIPSVDRELGWLMTGTVGLLVLASLAGAILKRTVQGDAARLVVDNFNARTRSWWVMVALFAAAIATRGVGTVVLFLFVSFLALREFLTLTPASRGDHRTLFWAFFVVTPLQYYLVGIRWYGLFSILIPVYAFLFIPIRNVIAGELQRFLERTALVQWALMICVYCVSHAPALLTLEIPGYEGQNAKLLFFFVLVVQMSDVLQYIWGKLCGRHKIAPVISPNKTWEGFLGGVVSSTLLGTTLWWVTPFTPLQAALIVLVTTLMGFAGGLTMSAIKRERGVKDYGSLIGGHGGVMDRIDSVCFAAPVFFHLTRYYFTP